MNMIPWKQLAEKNIEGIAAFALRLANHNGKINKQYIYKVVKIKNGIKLIHPKKIRGEYVNGGIRIPGEITNSFCTLYEVGYFANAMFLNAVVSALPISEYKKKRGKQKLLDRIKRDILSLSDMKIEKSFRSPKIPITSWLTDDVETYRFRKEMLYGVGNAVERKIIGEIKKEDLGKERSDEFRNVLWIEKDREITNIAIKHAKNMCQAKMIQYYLNLEEFFKLLGLDLEKVPFYFFCSPYHEVLGLGPKHEFIELLIEMHSPENVKMFSKITGQDNPVFIKIPCPKCGENNKKIISGRLKGDKRTVRLVCTTGETQFRNEHGLGTKIVRGCGHVWEFRIPGSKEELYRILKKGFSLNIALGNFLQCFRDTAISPVVHVIGDLNLYYN